MQLGGGECQQTHSDSCAWWWKPVGSWESLPGVQVGLQLGLLGSRTCMEKLPHMCKFPGRLSTRLCCPGLCVRMLPPCPHPWEGVGLNPPVALWSLEGQQDFPCLLLQLPFPMHNHTTSQATASLCLSPSQTNLNEPQEQLS